MNAAPQNTPVRMTRAHLNDLPEFDLPEGFTLRWYQPGDEAHWRRIHLAADFWNEITPDLFQQQFSSDTMRLRQRQCFLVQPTGEVIGTGTAWFKDDFAGGWWGRVHWLAILPEFQGRGLGKALLAAVCRRLRALGHERACLTTSAARIPAIALYLKFGFVPWIQSAADERVWRDLVRLAKH